MAVVSSRQDMPELSDQASVRRPRKIGDENSAQAHLPSVPARGLAGDSPAPPGHLIIGEGIEINGDVRSCDLLIVEGHMTSRTLEAKRLELRPGGSFEGEAKVEQAVIAGSFEGRLGVAGELRVAESGRLRGEIRYGTLEIAPGGRIWGDMSAAE